MAGANVERLVSIASLIMVLLPLFMLLSPFIGVDALDRTLVDGATGSDVVRAVIAKVDASRIAFGDDHRLLRRLAFVETSDGANSSSSSGGLWGLQQSHLDTVSSSPQLEELRIAIRAAFGIDWGTVKINDLGKPFFAGLVARLYLFYLEISGTAVIPLAGDIVGQARFWLTYYHSDVGGVSHTEIYFVEQVDILEEREGCKVNLDIFFVLDGSGSIGDTDFSQVRQFEHDFVDQLRIGPNDNQVGTIVFSDYGSLIFSLNAYNNKADILSQILNINYPGSSTNTADGLCKLVRYGFADGHGARPTSGAVFRIAIVMTDGKSNEESSECQWNTLQAAEAVHELSPPVLVYAIGVTSSVNDEELNAIATSPDFVTYIHSFDPHIIQETQESHVDEVCKRATLPADTDEEMNGTLDQNETVRYHYQIPVAGITLRVCISVGHVVVYGSFSVPNPNSAFYDFVLEFGSESNTSDTETCRNRYIDPDKIPQPHPPPNTQPSSTYQPSTGGAPTTTTTLAPQPTVVPSTAPPVVELTDKVVYLSVVGVARENNFVLNGSVGDIYPKPPAVTISTPTSDEHVVMIAVLAGGGGLLLLVFLLLTLVCSLCCCCCVCRRSKSTSVDQYDLLSRDSTSEWAGVE
jgi:hypothetical protein